jgi:hypothetical protein
MFVRVCRRAKPKVIGLASTQNLHLKPLRLASALLASCIQRPSKPPNPPSFREDRQRKATGFEVYTFPENHKQIKQDPHKRKPGGSKVTLLADNACARCSQLAQREGKMGWYHLDRSEDEKNKWVRKMPQPWQDGPRGPIHNIPHTTPVGLATSAKSGFVKIALGWRMLMASAIPMHGIIVPQRVD